MSDDVVLVRTMTEGDVAFAGELLAGEARVGVDDVRRRVQHLLRQGPSLCFVALIDGQPVGCLLAAYTGFHIVLEWLAARDDGRHRGVRRALHEAFVRECKKAPGTPVLAHAPLKDAPVYHHLGYRVSDALFLVKDG